MIIYMYISIVISSHTDTYSILYKEHIYIYIYTHMYVYTCESETARLGISLVLGVLNPSFPFRDPLELEKERMLVLSQALVELVD